MHLSLKIKLLTYHMMDTITSDNIKLTNDNYDIDNNELTISALLQLSKSNYDNNVSKPIIQKKDLPRSASRYCEVENCFKYSQGATKLCIRHGGGHRCSVEGCQKGARGRLYCALHGGGRRCSIFGCSKLSVGGSGYCSSHGGGKKCLHEGCIKVAQSPTSYCVRHGGGRLCQSPNCSKSARGKTKYCTMHNRITTIAIDSINPSLSSSQGQEDNLSITSDESNTSSETSIKKHKSNEHDNNIYPNDDQRPVFCGFVYPAFVYFPNVCYPSQNNQL